MSQVRVRAENGFAMIAVLGALTALLGLTAAAFAAAGGDIALVSNDRDQKIAYAAAEAGVADYMQHLNKDNAYWARCTNVPSPNAVNQPWNGTGVDTRTRSRTVPGTNVRYMIELLPAEDGNADYSTCDTNNAQASMIDENTGTFRIRTTGVSNGVKRSIVTTFRRRGFLDYLYFTDYETSDPAWYVLQSRGRQTRSGSSPSWTGPDLLTWAGQSCPKYWRAGRGGQSWEGQWFVPGSGWEDYPGQATCSEIQFAPFDRIRGPFHTNDEILVCGGPIFGRSSNDTIEVSGPGWRGNGGCSGNGPNFVGTWAPGSPPLEMPPSNTSLLNTVDPGYVFVGKTRITLGTSTINVNGTSLPYPPSGVIYVRNGVCGVPYNGIDPYNTPAGCADVEVKGTYGDDLTIASEKDIIVTGDTVRSGDKMLGLIANDFVRVYHPVTNRDASNPTSCQNDPAALQNVRIQAAILALNHSFTVDNYYCGVLGTLTVEGAIAQTFRGPVGTGSGNNKVSGYSKDYSYDDRLRFRSPPQFLDPVQASWRIQRLREQSPAR